MNKPIRTLMHNAAAFPRTREGLMHAINAAVMIFMAGYFLIAPGILIAVRISDANLAGPGIPRHAWRLHRKLTPRYEEWARQRVASGMAGQVDVNDVAGTEWPLFGSVFYLWATEALQEAWNKDQTISPVAPLEYARGAIEAGVELVLDPAHHRWVRKKWGENYMDRENLFFRSLVIAATLSHDKLEGNGKYREILRRQAVSLAEEIDASPYGLLDDYPAECYPLDVMAAIAITRDAYWHLGLDPEDWVSRSRRAFDGGMLDHMGLVPYMINARTGHIEFPSRGLVHAWAGVFAHGLYPDLAERWQETLEEHFWQEGFFAGFREFLPDGSDKNNWLYDVDAGPIIAGYSPAANAFGYAAARVNGRLDLARTLGEQILLATWPLPDGTLLGARILSISPHAPYLGEATLLYFLTRETRPGIALRNNGRRPPAVWLGLSLYFTAGLVLVLAALTRLKKFICAGQNTGIPFVSFPLWAGLVAFAFLVRLFGYPHYAVIMALLAQLLPRLHSRRGEYTHPS